MGRRSECKQRLIAVWNSKVIKLLTISILIEDRINLVIIEKPGFDFEFSTKFVRVIKMKDGFVSDIDEAVVFRKLQKLSDSSLCDLARDWLPKSKKKRQLAQLLARAHEQKVAKNTMCKFLAARLHALGLDLKQLAELDCLCLFQNPNLYKWTAMTTRNNKRQAISQQILPEKLIASLKNDLHGIFRLHTYFCAHPNLPLYIIRIQLFDPEELSSYSKLANRAPFYIAIPYNSATIIFSAGSDVYAKLIINSVSRSVCHRKNIALERCEKLPVRNLNTMAVLRSLTRDSNAMGPWSPYAENSVESPPIIKARSCKTSNAYTNLPCSFEKSMMRFTGKAHQFSKPVTSSQTTEARLSECNSLMKVPRADFIITNKSSNDQNITFKVKLFGTDIFGGLHELCDQGYIDIAKVPGWATGENGPKSGTILNGDFQEHETARRLDESI